MSREISDFLDLTFLRFLEADMVMDDTERKLSNERLLRYKKQYREFLDDQQRKYGGGIMGSSFDPINVMDEFVFKG